MVGGPQPPRVVQHPQQPAEPALVRDPVPTRAGQPASRNTNSLNRVNLSRESRPRARPARRAEVLTLTEAATHLGV